MTGPFLTIAEAAELARVSPKRLRELMRTGALREGKHYTRPHGIRPRFRRDALIAWLEGEALDGADDEALSSPRARCRVNLSLGRR